MARVADHLSVDDLEARLRSAQDPTATRHVQVIWLLARGHTIADVAAVTSFVPRWIEQLYEGPGVAETNHGACGGSSECFSSGAAVPVLHGRDRGAAPSGDLASGQRPRECRGRGHGVVCAALGGDPMGAIGSTLLSGRVRGLNHPPGATMRALCPRPDEHAAVRTDLKAIFVSLELSRSTWVITSLAPGGGEKISKHSVRSGDIGALLARLSQLKEKARVRTGQVFPIIVIQEAGLDGFWIHRVLDPPGPGSTGSCKAKGSRAMSSIPPRSRRPVGVGGRRPTRSTVRLWCGPCWPTSGASPGFVRWSRLRLPRRRIGAGSVASARP